MQTAGGVVGGKELEAAKAFERAMSNKPIEDQLAVSLISKNVLNGCSWELTREVHEIKRNLDAFRQSGYCSVQEVTYNHQKKVTGYLVYMQLEKLLELLGPSNNGPLDSRDVELAKRHRSEAGAAFIKKLQKGYKGKIGIFCTNDSQTITVSGKAYPAYALTLKEVCAICSKAGYGIVVGGEPRLPADVLKKEDAVLKTLVVAPSSNALFLDVAPMKRR